MLLDSTVLDEMKWRFYLSKLQSYEDSSEKQTQQQFTNINLITFTVPATQLGHG